mmetsp:Transcript_3853/g.15909  ORF Transcript_3853/g.15909 Transcript_3853/m.15909 type:complete len:377 (+) Transcript_3853:776-1906(+)
MGWPATGPLAVASKKARTTESRMAGRWATPEEESMRRQVGRLVVAAAGSASGPAAQTRAAASRRQPKRALTASATAGWGSHGSGSWLSSSSAATSSAPRLSAAIHRRTCPLEARPSATREASRPTRGRAPVSSVAPEAVSGAAATDSLWGTAGGLARSVRPERVSRRLRQTCRWSSPAPRSSRVAAPGAEEAAAPSHRARARGSVRTREATAARRRRDWEEERAAEPEGVRARTPTAERGSIGSWSGRRGRSIGGPAAASAAAELPGARAAGAWPTSVPRTSTQAAMPDMATTSPACAPSVSGTSLRPAPPERRSTERTEPERQADGLAASAARASSQHQTVSPGRTVPLKIRATARRPAPEARSELEDASMSLVM